MTRRRTAPVAAVCLACAALLMVTSTGGFSAAKVDRGVEIAVADDSSAYVGYATTCGDDGFEVAVTNRFSTRSVDGTVTVNGTTEPLEPSPVGPGETNTVEFDEGFDPGDPVTVEVSGSGVSVELYRSVPRGCDDAPEAGDDG